MEYKGGQYEQTANRDVNLQQTEMLRGIVSGRPMFASVDVDIASPQKVVADAGSLLWMDGELQMETNMFGGCCQGLGRECAGESCCMNTYSGTGKIGFGFPLPGDMMSFGVVPGGGWILSRGSFVAGTSNINISAKFIGCCACLFAGEGPFLTHVYSKTGNGMFFAGGFGSIVRHDIPAGQIFYVDNGLFFAAHEKTKIRITPLGGIKTFCCSGEGLVMKFVGPCVIFTQSRDPTIFKPPEPKEPGDQPGAVA
jgi:uncharacterized protein (TIGR00266 family)